MVYFIDFLFHSKFKITEHTYNPNKMIDLVVHFIVQWKQNNNWDEITIFQYLYKSIFFNSFPNKPWFLRVYRTSLLKTLLEKEKLVVKSNFSFSRFVFYPFGEVYAVFVKFEIVVCKLFKFGWIHNLLFGKGLNAALNIESLLNWFDWACMYRPMLFTHVLFINYQTSYINKLRFQSVKH